MIRRTSTAFGLLFLAAGIFGGIGPVRADLIGSAPETDEESVSTPQPAPVLPAASAGGGASTAETALREHLRAVGLSTAEVDQRVAALSPAEREAVARDPRQVQVAGIADWLIGIGISAVVMLFRWLFGF